MYTKLNSDPAVRQIRLIHLLPGTWRDGIECTLEVVALNDKPQYKALSYVWGDAGKTKPITVNGQPFAVTENLYNGLQRIRDPRGQFTLWVDAICINQADMAERQHQVQLMGEIFSNAVEVVAWLGYSYKDAQVPPEQPKIYNFSDEEMVKSVMKDFLERYWLKGPEAEFFNFDYQEKEGGWVKVPNIDEEEVEDEDSCDLKEEKSECDSADREKWGQIIFDGEDLVLGFAYLRLLNDIDIHEMPMFRRKDTAVVAVHKSWGKALHGLDSFCTATWWTRVWTFQEMVLASKATLLYHNVTIPWELVGCSTYNCVRHVNSCCTCGKFFTTYGSLTMRNLHMVVWDINGVKIRTGLPSLKELLSRTQLRNTTDIRDKVYGVLGLIPSERMIALRPDYNKKPAEVFIHATWNDIVVLKGLVALQGTPRTDIPGLPSWVTEYTQASSGELRLAEFGRTSCAKLFRASFPTEEAISLAGSVLYLSSFPPFDQVAQVGTAMWPSEYDDSISENHPPGFWNSINRCWNISRIAKEKHNVYGGEQNWCEAFWRTMANDCHFTSEHWNRFGDAMVHTIPEQLRTKAMSEEQLSADNFAYWLRFELSLGMSAARRRFFITKDGFMGIGPLSMLPSDEIVIFCGACTPFCIRKHLDWMDSRPLYTLVGDVYVQGVMDGEAVPENWEEKVIQIQLV